MTLREARETLDVHELVQDSLTHGPVSLARFARIRSIASGDALSVERNARRLVARLCALGYCIDAKGDGRNLVVNFAQDEALVAKVERLVDHAQSLKNNAYQNNAFQNDPCQNNSIQTPADEPGERDCLPLEAMRRAREAGLSVVGVARRFHVDTNKAQELVGAHGALGCAPRRRGHARVEEERGREAIERALALPPGRGRMKRVAAALGCSRQTARALLRRLAAESPPGPGK